MEKLELTILIINTILIIVSIKWISYKTVINREKFIQSVVDSINLENMELTDCFSKDVISFYMDVLKNAKYYSINQHTLSKEGSGISVWVANDIDSRKFHTHDQVLIKEVEKKNKSLTHYDKVLLDKIAKSFENKQSKLVTKFFID